MQVARSRLEVGIRPEGGLQYLAMDRVAGVDREQAQDGARPWLDGGQVNGAAFDDNAEAAETANRNRRRRPRIPEGDHVFARIRGDGRSQRRNPKFFLHALRQAAILGGPLRLELGECQVGKEARARCAAVAGETLRLQRRLAGLRSAGPRQRQRKQ